MGTLKFTVDSKLLRELGERLVGKPSVALGELVKNGYDADAENVKVVFDTTGDGLIVVSDDGHGMNFKEFKAYWMRIGSTHKEKWFHSPHFKRPLTGHKGIGRLAVQFLAGEMELTTVSKKDTQKMLSVRVRWEDAIEAGDLVQSEVEYEESEGRFESGTVIRLKGLRHEWDERDFKELARDIWMLMPPFRGFQAETGGFDVKLKTKQDSIGEAFEEQKKAFLNAYEGKVVGKNTNGHVQISLMNDRWGRIDHEYELTGIRNVRLPAGKELKNGEFEIRIYRLEGHQAFRIRVGDLREYMDEYSGIHIYDSGFRLPYYGDKHSDWLGISDDQTRRITVSDILPDDLQVLDGLTLLPGLRRMLGVVKISTAQEPGLEMAITRDRLIETETYRALVGMVKYAIHLYAMKEREHSARSSSPFVTHLPEPKVLAVEEVLERRKDDIAPLAYEELKREIRDAITVTETREKNLGEQISFLGAFATAGIASLAYHHEIQKQLRQIDDITNDIGKMLDAREMNLKRLESIQSELKGWGRRANQLEGLFSHYGNAETLKDIDSYPARRTVDELVEQVGRLLPDTRIVNDIPEGIRLPPATLAEWSSVFQNVLINAYNAMYDSETRLIRIRCLEKQDEKVIIVEDTGCGVDLTMAEELFEPFKRHIDLPPEKQALGYGGTGIGLTIVRLIARRANCTVQFVEPEDGFATALEIRWREEK